LSSAGMLIGAHGRTHRYLSDLAAFEMDNELRGSRARLEDLLGVPVPGMSLPGGRLSARLRDRIGAAGYRFLFTSRIALASPVDDPLDRPRVPITNWLKEDFLERLLAGDDRQVRAMARSARLRDLAKTVLGNRLYDRLRTAVLRRNT
ncbi:polysaccharide deacetylase family protein, partial [bacterium]|nr:polysaccharide deacetylase family protein [bacterium]